ncbi:MAG: TetR/AcrR family transcriptional regulator [Leptotrichiaceae bacterium]|jgi:TetR/AcrR family transcriptional regulator, transcriptional repressor for nem operon|nr:TetR/AcrR family transcriptional regulator [Fusobacteriaceae bacterium]MBP8762955.1 TetR/AcrR family transcriptional regulator [Acetoanaerobium sp.]MBP9562183.1 TetR/AcrR family transcriptional regulator [Acetoanaerobium sp.]
MARKREFDENEALKKAMEIFWLHGYEKTSIEELVKCMGVHRKSIYDTFGNKYELFIKSLEYYSTTIGEQLLKRIGNEKTSLEKIKALFNYNHIDIEEVSNGCLIVNTGVELSLHDEHIAKIVQYNFIETEKVIYHILKQGQCSGEFSSELDLRVTSQFINNALIGIRVQLKTIDNKEKLKSIIDTTLSILTN